MDFSTTITFNLAVYRLGQALFYVGYVLVLLSMVWQHGIAYFPQFTNRKSYRRKLIVTTIGNANNALDCKALQAVILSSML